MNGRQKLRDAHAREIVQRLLHRGGAKEVLAGIAEAANDPTKLHLTPHLVTAARDCNLWPDIRRSDLTS